MMHDGDQQSRRVQQSPEDEQVRSFFDDQLKQKREEEAKKQEERSKEATKNQVSQAQKDLRDEKCDKCGKTDTLVTKQHEGTLVCRSCGIVQMHSMIDQTNEKRHFSNELQGADASGNRVNARGNPFLPSQGLYTEIIGNSKEVKNLQKLHYPKIGGFEKNITQGFNRIRLVAESLNLNHQDVKNMAFEYLKRIEDNKLLKGKSLDAKVAVVIFMAARNTQKRKKIDDILRYVNTTKSEINKCFKKCKDIIIDKRI